jgi:ribosome-associated toxin RatA of RatAB toxin-antitoxin module
MHTRETANEILIHGDPNHVYALASAVEEWPTFLPHYRWVRVYGREGNRRTVEMAAWRTGIPIHWVSHQWLWPEERRFTFRHIGGLSRGMEVEWRIEPQEAMVRVTITHQLSLEVPVVRTPPGQWVVGEMFVKAVASRTLAYLKRRVEGAGMMT